MRYATGAHLTLTHIPKTYKAYSHVSGWRRRIPSPLYHPYI